VQLLRRQGVIGDGVLGDAGADQQLVGPEPFHNPELVLGPAQIAGEDVGRDGLEVTEGLVDLDGETEVRGPETDLLGTHRAGEQVVLEDLDAVEARGRGGGELFGERAAERHRGDGLTHFVLRRGAVMGSPRRIVHTRTMYEPER
jgi:hypothetical protein